MGALQRTFRGRRRQSPGTQVSELPGCVAQSCPTRILPREGRPCRHEPLRSDDQNSEDGCEHEGVAVGPEAEREQRLQGDGQGADREASEDCTRQASHAADDRGDEGEQDDVDADRGRHRARLRGEQDRRRRGKQAGESERCGNHRVGADPEHTCHLEVLGGGAHLRPQRRPPKEEANGDEQDDRHGDDDHVELLDHDRADRERSAQARREIRRSRQRAPDEPGNALEQEAERERGDQQRLGSCPPDGAECDPLHCESERDDDHHGHRDQHWRRQRNQHDRERARHDQLAVGEVDQPHDSEDDGDAEREQREQASERDRVDHILDHEVLRQFGNRDHRAALKRRGRPRRARSAGRAPLAIPRR